MDSYLQDFRRYCLAITMLRFGARPGSVRHFMGFSRQRMRQVVRSYDTCRGPDEPPLPSGPPPTALKKFLKDPQLRAELTAAAALCQVLDVITQPGAPTKADGSVQSVLTAERLCRTFALYQRLVPNGHLTLEHLMVLVISLGSTENWALERCNRCDSFLLTDPLSLGDRLCSDCREPNRVATQGTEPAVEDALIATHEPAKTGFQHSLF
jgi:hypothetical protein